LKSGSLNLLKSSVPAKACNAVALLFTCDMFREYILPRFTVFPGLQDAQAHKMHPDFFMRNFRKNGACILILVIYWKKTGLLSTEISNHNIIYSS
jgi:hypothetical protein